VRLAIQLMPCGAATRERATLERRKLAVESAQSITSPHYGDSCGLGDTERMIAPVSASGGQPPRQGILRGSCTGGSKDL